MSQVPDATQVPFSTFQEAPGANGTPAQFYAFLSSLSKKMQEKNPEEMSNKQEWKQVIRALADSFLNSLPSPHELPWNAIHESIKLTEVSVTLIDQVTALPQSTALFATEDLGKDVFVLLLKLYMTLDVWVDVSVPPEPDYPSPEELQKKVFGVCVVLLRCLGAGGIVDSEGSSIANEKIRRSFVDGCLELCEGMFCCSDEAH